MEGGVTLKARRAARERRVLGIDPGTTVTGWGVVDSSGDVISRVASGILRPRGERAAKLGAIFDRVRELCEEYRPDALSLEQSFVGDNVQTALRLGEARGSVMVAAMRGGVAVHEYSPAAIKMAVAGSGRADKSQIMAMVVRLLCIDSTLVSDEADALGAAICHLNTSRFDARISAAPAIGRHARPHSARRGSQRWR
jgi:crossover junction endodeoxyribonuclease RuvC